MTALDNSLGQSSLASRAAASLGQGAAPDGASEVATGRTADARLAIELMSKLRGGAITLHLPGEYPFVVGEGRSVASWHVRDAEVFGRVLSQGDIGLGETFIDGLWDSDNPTALLQLLASNRQSLSRAVYGRPWKVVGHWLRHLGRANTRRGSQRNIAAHYDLGNDFYALWLDRTMSYSSAVFEAPDESLARAQLRKYRRILQRLGARPGQTILEVGCGWGGFAEVAATEYGCRVLAITLSREQLEYARRRALSGGFDDLVDFELCDYRDVRGEYDHIVSIEMIEAVGERFWPTWFSQISDRLRPGGKAIVQAITIDNALFGRYRKGTDFIQQYIFPGGMLPSVGAFRAQASDAGMVICGDKAFGRDYATTLQRWHEAFQSSAEAVRERGFDERFIRMWRFYLSYCEAGFRAGDIDVHQFELCHREDG